MIPRLLVFFAAIVFAGCQTPHEFSLPSPNSKNQVGQLRYQAKERSMIGDVVVSLHASNQFNVTFSTGPGFPLIKLQQEGQKKRAEGVLARGQWQGSRIPSHLQSWFSLEEAFLKCESEKGEFKIESPNGWNANGKKQGDKLIYLKIEFPAPNEQFTFYFDPET